MFSLCSFHLTKTYICLSPKRAQKHAVDEVDSFTDEAAIFSVEKMANFLRQGTESQRTVVLFEVQQLLSHCFEETIRVLVPILCELVHTWSEDLQMAVSEAMNDVVSIRSIPKETAKLIVDASFRVIECNKSEAAFEAWGEILVQVLPDVECDGHVEVSKMIRAVDQFSKTRRDPCRKLAARVLGSLSVCLKTTKVKSIILKHALIMSHDADVEVRGMVAESFAFIGAGLDLEVTESLVWPRLAGMLEDPDARIHAACLRSIGNIVEAKREKHPDCEMFKKLLPEVFSRECAFARRAASEDQRKVDDDTYLLLEIVAEVFGPYLHAIHSHLDDESEKKEAFKAFYAMTSCNGPIVRRYCAFNLPGVAVSLRSKFQVELAGIVGMLAKDTDSETRWNLAAGIHETCKILSGKHTQDCLHTAILGLLSDENPLVRMNALEHFYELLKVLTQDRVGDISAVLSPVFQRLSMLSDGNWRTQEILARQLERICEIVPASALRQHILPLLYQMAEEGTHCVRSEAMPAIARAIWCIPIPTEREEVLRTFHSAWGTGGVFWMRISFVDCAEAALKVFSADLFLHLFGFPLYQLARDAVPNVRLRVARMLHLLAPFASNDENYKSAVEVLRNDSDIDVLDIMQGIEGRIEKVMKDVKSFRQKNEMREEKEARLEARAGRERAELRKRSTRTKMKAAKILPNIASRAGNLSTELVQSLTPRGSTSNIESPVSVLISDGEQASLRPSKSARFGSKLSLSGLKTRSSVNEEMTSGAATASPRSGIPTGFLSNGGALLSPRGAGRKAMKILRGGGGGGNKSSRMI